MRGRRVHARSIALVKRVKRFASDAQIDPKESEIVDIDASQSNACAATQSVVVPAVKSAECFKELVGKSDAGPKLRKRRSSIQDAVSAVQTFQAFVSAIHETKPTVKCYILSLHGCSSLRMFEAKPRAWMDKVRDQVS